MKFYCHFRLCKAKLYRIFLYILHNYLPNLNSVTSRVAK